MNQTFQNSAQVLSIGIFFSLMVIGLAATLPATLGAGLQDHGVSPATADQISSLPPITILFAAFLGYNPIEHLLGPDVLSGLTASDQAALTGSSFFPDLISAPFHDGLHVAFIFAIFVCLIAGTASLLRGGGDVSQHLSGGAGDIASRDAMEAPLHEPDAAADPEAAVSAAVVA